MNTNHAFWAPIYVGEVDAGVANSWRVYERGDFGHVLEAKLIEQVRVLILEVRQIDVFLEVLILRAQLSKGAHHMDVRVEYGWHQAMLRRRRR